MRLGDTENDVSRMQIYRGGDEIRVEARDDSRGEKKGRGDRRRIDDNKRGTNCFVKYLLIDLGIISIRVCGYLFIVFLLLLFNNKLKVCLI